MASKHEIIVADYHGLSVSFTDDGWFNATAAADRFGKRVDNWLRLDETAEYMQALSEDSNTSEVRDLVRTKRGHGGGTWLHPDLAVSFARWLDVRFAIWCDRQIRALITGTHPHHDQRRLRHEASASYKVMSQTLLESRLADDKETKPHHFMTEAKVVNFAICGEFHGLDRDQMSIEDLDLLARLEIRNTVMLARGLPYAERKEALKACADAWRVDHPRLQAA
jgi:hypothetical protein